MFEADRLDEEKFEVMLAMSGRTPRALLALSSRLQDVEADAAAHVDIGVVDRSLEEDFWRGFVCMARRPVLKGFDMGYGISKLCGGVVRGCSCRLVLSR